MDRHVDDTKPIVLKRLRPESARPRRPPVPTVCVEEEPKVETTKLSVAQRVAQARVARGYKTRKELATALSISVDVITCIESQRGNVDKQKLNKVCQFLKIKTK
jgi:ribosome-binding protein aMBF1 (putative translation factor)